MVKPYKDISIWWDKTYGGEYRLHTDFVVGADEGFAEALAELFKDFEPLRPVGRRGGGPKKCHLEMSIYEERKEVDH